LRSKVKKIGIIFSVFIFLLILFLIPMIKNPKIGFIIAILLQFFLYVYLAQAWNLVGGITGLFSLGHSLFFGIGAYSLMITTVKFNMNPWSGIVIGITLCIIISILVGITSSRLSGLFFAMFTIGLIKIFLDISVQWIKITGGSHGIVTPGALTINTKQAYYIFLIMCILSIFFVWFIRKSRLGTMCVSIRENENFAKTLGVRTDIWKIVIFMISAVMVCLAGFIFAMYFRAIYPTMAFSFSMSTKMIIVTLIGGAGTVLGPLLGGIIIIIDELIRVWMGSSYAGISYIVYGILLVLLIIFFPKGLMGKISSKIKRIK